MTEAEYRERCVEPENIFQVGDTVKVIKGLSPQEKEWIGFSGYHIPNYLNMNGTIVKGYHGWYEIDITPSRWYPYFVLEYYLPSLKAMTKSRFKEFDTLVGKVKDGSYYNPKPEPKYYTYDYSFNNNWIELSKVLDKINENRVTFYSNVDFTPFTPPSPHISVADF